MGGEADPSYRIPDVAKLLEKKEALALARIQRLKASYRFPKGMESQRIIGILFSNAHTVAVLTEAAMVLQSLFGPAVQLFLHLDRDPEDGSEKVFATVRTSHPPEVGLQLLTEFDQRWWLERLPKVKGKLNFAWEPSG